MSRFERNVKKENPKEKVVKKEEESNFLKQAFDLFDRDHSGKINIKDAINSMKRTNFEESNPELYNLINSIYEEGEENITWEDFSNYINEGLKDRKNEDGLKTIFNLFIDNPENETINFETFKKICKEIGENLSEEQLEHILNNTTEHGNEITFKDFIQYMKVNEK